VYFIDPDGRAPIEGIKDSYGNSMSTASVDYSGPLIASTDGKGNDTSELHVDNDANRSKLSEDSKINNNQNGGDEKNTTGGKICEDCPEKSETLEYTVHKSKDDNNYVLVAGNWILQTGKEKQDDLFTANDGTTYSFYNGRWIPLYDPEGLLKEGTFNWFKHTLLVWTPTAIVTKSWKVSGIGTGIDYIVTLGETGEADYFKYRDRYFTKSEIKQSQNNAAKLVAKY
jgi:hypothetical protein